MWAIEKIFTYWNWLVWINCKCFSRFRLGLPTWSQDLASFPATSRGAGFGSVWPAGAPVGKKICIQRVTWCNLKWFDVLISWDSCHVLSCKCVFWSLPVTWHVNPWASQLHWMVFGSLAPSCCIRPMLTSSVSPAPKLKQPPNSRSRCLYTFIYFFCVWVVCVRLNGLA